MGQSGVAKAESSVNTDEYEIIEMRGAAQRPKEVIDLKVVDECVKNESKYLVVRLTKKFVGLVLCLFVSIVIMLIAIVVSVHYIFHM